MADDISSKIQSILQNPEMMNMVSGLMGQGSSSAPMPEDEPIDTGFDMQNVIGRLNNSDDKRIRLLNALKPYMKNKRATDIDKAIKMLKISKISSILKDL